MPENKIEDQISISLSPQELSESKEKIDQPYEVILEPPSISDSYYALYSHHNRANLATLKAQAEDERKRILQLALIGATKFEVGDPNEEEVIDGDLELKPLEHLLSAMKYVEAGGFNPDQIKVLTEVSQLVQVFGLDLTSFPLDWYFEHSEFIHASLIICTEIEIFWGRGFLKNNPNHAQDVLENLYYLDSLDRLGLITQSINIDGFVLGHSLAVTMIHPICKSGEVQDDADAVSARGKSFLLALDAYAESSAKGNIEQVQLAQSLFSSELSLDTVGQMSDLCEILVIFSEAAKSMERYDLEDLIYYVGGNHLELCLRTLSLNEKQSEMVTIFFGNLRSIDDDQLRMVVIETILASVTRKNRYFAALYAARTYEVNQETHNFLLDLPIIDSLTQNQITILELCIEAYPAYSFASKVFQGVDDIDVFFDESKLNTTFIKFLLNKYSLPQLTRFFKNSSTNRFLSSEVQREYCLFYKIPTALQDLYFSDGKSQELSSSNFNKLIDADGHPTLLFLNGLIKNGSLQGLYGVDEIRYLQKSFSPDILSKLHINSRQFFSFFVKIEDIHMLRSMFAYYQEIFWEKEEYFDNNLPTSELLIRMLGFRPQGYEISNADRTILLEIIEQFPSDLRDGWIILLDLYNQGNFEIDKHAYSRERIAQIGTKYHKLQLDNLTAKYPDLAFLLTHFLDSSEITISNFIRLYELLIQTYPDSAKHTIQNWGEYLLSDAQENIVLIIDLIKSGKVKLLTNLLLQDSVMHRDEPRIEIISEIIIPHCEKIDALLSHIESYKYEDILHSIPGVANYLLNSIRDDGLSEGEMPAHSDKDVVSKCITQMSESGTEIDQIIFFLEDRRMKTGLDIPALLIEIWPEIPKDYFEEYFPSVVELYSHYNLSNEFYELRIQSATELSRVIKTIFKDYQKNNPSNAEVMRLLKLRADLFINSMADLRIIEEYLEKAGSANLLVNNRKMMTEMIRLLDRKLAESFVTEILNLAFISDGQSYNGDKIEARKASPYRLARRNLTGPSQESFRSLPEKLSSDSPGDFILTSKQDAYNLLGLVMNSVDPEEYVDQLSRFDLSFGIQGYSYQSLLRDIRFAVNLLPPTAEGFNIHNQRLSKSRRFPPFIAILKPKIEELFFSQIDTNTLEANQLPHLLRSILTLYLDALKMYQYVSTEIVPHVARFNKLVDQKLLGEGVWFSGRDGVPLFVASKASNWGRSLGKRIQYVKMIYGQIRQDEGKTSKVVALALEKRKLLDPSVSQEKFDEDQLFEEGMKIYLQTEARLADFLKFISLSRITIENMKRGEREPILIRELARIGITSTMIGADTGGSGSVMKGAMEIALRTMPRSQMILWGCGQDYDKSYYVIEELPKYADRTIVLDDDGKPVAFPTEPDEQLLAWVVDHVMMRSFVAKTEDTPSSAAPESR